LLLSHPKIDINSKNNKGQTSLHRAIETNNRDTIKALLSDTRIKLNITDNKGRTPRDLASHRGFLDLLERGL